MTVSQEHGFRRKLSDVKKPLDPLETDSMIHDLSKAATAYEGRRVPGNVSFPVLMILTITSIIVRVYNLSSPPEVVFDEVHFGGFASKYLNQEFFMDVHPPLGKLLVAFSGLLGGYNGSFSFKEIGLAYTADVPFKVMRFFPALLGALLTPMAYATMRNLGFSTRSSILAATMVILENAYLCHFRLIMLDSYLVFFTGLTLLMWSEFQRHADAPFSVQWWKSLTYTGVALGLTLSVKWVGLFMVATIGVMTIFYLWSIITDGSIPIKTFTRHFYARAICLIVVPLSVYAFIFQIHFSLLSKTGGAMGFMSPEFQSTLKGNEIQDTYAEVAIGSKIILRHEQTKGGYLHSHPHFYPGGSKQQQITCYPFRDENSWFLIKPQLIYVNRTMVEQSVTEFTRLKHGDVIRLDHVPTQRRLHSHDVRPVFNDDKELNEVSGYGEKGFLGDSNDHWMVEQVNPDPSHPEIDAIHTRIRLKHVNSGCYLLSRTSKLPEWGFGQQEVYCSSKGLKKLTIWRIEYNEHPDMPDDATLVNYKKPGFWSKLFELHKVMADVNNGLTSSHPFDSRPASWPFLTRGISYWSSKTPGRGGNIYLIGNPFIWWVSSVSTVIFLAYQAVAAVIAKRGLSFSRILSVQQAFNASWVFFIGWALHYFPFFIMKRQLFLHHYLPALYFSILLFAAIFDILTLRLRSYLRLAVLLFVTFLFAWTFVAFSAFAYGSEISYTYCQGLKWRSKWDFNCPANPDAPQPIVAETTTLLGGDFADE